MILRLPTNLELAQACAQTYNGIPPMWQDDLKLVHVFFFHNPDWMPTIAWEGTSDWEEWLFSDFMAAEIPVKDHPTLGPVHSGLARGPLAVVHQITKYLDSLGWPPYANTGHSKGAGEALLFHLLMKDLGHPPAITRAFEPPRAGSKALAGLMAGENFAWTRTRNIHGNDLVTDVPWGFGWSHVGDPILLTVPDSYDIPTKHRIPAVIEALKAQEPVPA